MEYKQSLSSGWMLTVMNSSTSVVSLLPCSPATSLSLKLALFFVLFMFLLLINSVNCGLTVLFLILSLFLRLGFSFWCVFFVCLFVFVCFLAYSSLSHIHMKKVKENVTTALCWSSSSFFFSFPLNRSWSIYKEIQVSKELCALGMFEFPSMVST